MPKRRRGSMRLPKRHRPPQVAEAGDAPRTHPQQCRSWYRDASGVLRTNLDPKEFPAIIAAGKGTLWVDLDQTDAAQAELLGKTFDFHPLSIEDTRSADGRVKFEEFATYALAVVRGVRFVDETADPYDVETFNLCCFLGRNYLVTVHGSHAPGADAVARRLERGGDLLGRGAARMLHEVLDATVDAYFPIIDQLDEFVDGLEERVFVRFDQEALRDIFSVKRLVLQLRRHLGPMREVFNVMQSRPCSLLPTDAQIYYRDIYDHVIRLNESLDTYRDLLSSTLDSYLSQVSNRMGQVTKGLTVVATLSVPFVVVSGMWGMNFNVIPFAGSPYGFWYMLALQLGLGFGLIALLKSRGWL